MNSLSNRQRMLVGFTAFIGLVFDGFELGLMPLASLAVSQSLLGEAYTDQLGGEWFAWFTAALMLGAACGGIVLGNLGDRWGRTRAMALSILIYSVFAGLGASVTSQSQMLLLRFLVGVGTGGMLPNGIALVAECWPHASRPFISGVMGAGINVGILMLAGVTQLWPVTVQSWRWLFTLSACPAVVGVIAWCCVPESPTWLAKRTAGHSALSLRELFGSELRRATVVGILLGAIPLIGAWASSKWMVPWASLVAGKDLPQYKGTVQACWAVGATLGSFGGALVAGWLGRRTSYFLTSATSLLATLAMFQISRPLAGSFLPLVFAQGLTSTLFFGWLPLYLPELFPTRARASGMGLSYNVGRFATAFAVVGAGYLFRLLEQSYTKEILYPQVGSICALVYALGMLVVWFAPDTSGRSLES